MSMVTSSLCEIHSFNTRNAWEWCRRHQIPVSMVTSMVGRTLTFATPEVLKKTKFTITFPGIFSNLTESQRYPHLIILGASPLKPHFLSCLDTRKEVNPAWENLPVGFEANCKIFYRRKGKTKALPLCRNVGITSKMKTVQGVSPLKPWVTFFPWWKKVTKENQGKTKSLPLCLNARITGRGGILKTGSEKPEAYF